MHHHTSLHHFIQEVAPTLSITLMTNSVVTTVESFFNCRLIGGVRCQVLKEEVPSLFGVQSPGAAGIDVITRAWGSATRATDSTSNSQKSPSMPPPPVVDATVLSVFQLISALEANCDEEWLYNVDANKNDTYDAVVMLGIADRIPEAQEALSSILSKQQENKDVDLKKKKVVDGDDTALQLCIANRLEKMKTEAIQDFAVSLRPARLW